MSKVSKDYQKIIERLDDLQDICKEEAEIQLLKETMDIISDYEKVVADLNRMIQHYETPERARMVTEDLYICPHCGKRTKYNHSHCNWCGKKLGWRNRLKGR